MAYQRQKQCDIFDAIFRAPLRRDHELILLGERIDWEEITQRLLPFYSKRGRRAKNVRLMVGLHILKHLFDLSDEEVVQGLHENVYWMVFCGVKLEPQNYAGGQSGEEIRPCCFLESSTLTKFRNRLGAQGMKLVEETIRELLIREKQLKARSQYVDTTAQPKNIAYPVDTDLLNTGRRRVVKTLKALGNLGVEVARGVRSFSRLGKQVIEEINKLGKGRQERIESGLKKLSGYAQQVLKSVPRVIEAAKDKIERLVEEGKHKAAKAVERLKQQLETDQGILTRVIHQVEKRLEGIHIPGKIYSLHEPHVACIRKGKRSRPNEYGTKVILSVDRGGYVVDHQEYASNPYDSELLDETCERWEEIFDSPAKELGADRGFHRNPQSPTPHVKKIQRVSIPTKGKTPHPQAQTPWFKPLQRQRVKIEPIIGHLKTDHGMDRCRYKGFEGDQINVCLAVMAWNLKKWGKQLTTQAA